MEVSSVVGEHCDPVSEEWSEKWDACAAVTVSAVTASLCFICWVKVVARAGTVRLRGRVPGWCHSMQLWIIAMALLNLGSSNEGDTWQRFPYQSGSHC